MQYSCVSVATVPNSKSENILLQEVLYISILVVHTGIILCYILFPSTVLTKKGVFLIRSNLIPLAFIFSDDLQKKYTSIRSILYYINLTCNQYIYLIYLLPPLLYAISESRRLENAPTFPHLLPLSSIWI